MPRPARKRQVGTATAAAPSLASQSIASFARVSKSQSALGAPSGKKAAVVVAAPPAPLIDLAVSKKRKASSFDNNEHEHHPRVTRRTISFPPSSDDDQDHDTPAKRSCRRDELPVAVVAPSLKQKPVQATVRGKQTAKTTPSRKVSAHKASESTIIAKSKQSGKTIQTRIDTFAISSKKTTPAKGDKRDVHDSDSEFPPHISDLIRLHKAFVQTLVVQLVHGGSNAPMDVTAIVPNISRLWGKRQVNVEDIRRCIAIQTSTNDPKITSPFVLSDYGRGKVCVELRPGQTYDGAFINEERLCQQFETNLRGLCVERATDEMIDVGDVLQNLSLADLPQAAIADMDLGLNANPVLAKGQRALLELKDGIAAKKQQKETPPQAAADALLLNPDGTKMSLLDRLRHKQLANANGPLAPSGPELQRRAALNRVTAISATISMLSLSNPISLPRQAFTMAIIQERLKDSLRVPTSKEEAASCVRLIASEIAPEWLKVVMIGGRENVVIQRNYQPVDRIIHERVQKLMS